MIEGDEVEGRTFGLGALGGELTTQGELIDKAAAIGGPNQAVSASASPT